MPLYIYTSQGSILPQGISIVASPRRFTSQQDIRFANNHIQQQNQHHQIQPQTQQIYSQHYTHYGSVRSMLFGAAIGLASYVGNEVA
jgi:hypothetical protein